MITVEDVRVLTGITTDEIPDTEIEKIILYSYRQLMNDITVQVTRPLRAIDVTRINYKIEGAEGWIFDTNNDGLIDYTDVEIFYFDAYGVAHSISEAFTYYQLDNRLVFHNPLPSGVQYYISYREVYSNNQALIEQAHLWLTAYVLTAKIWGIGPQVIRLGRSGWDVKKPGQMFLNTYNTIKRGLNPKGGAIEYASHPSLLDNTF